MRPFSALMYVTRNKARSLVLTMMLAFTTICYIAGLYVGNPYESFVIITEDPNSYMLVSAGSASREAREAYSELCGKIEDYAPEGAKTILPVNVCYYEFKSMMGFSNGSSTAIFTSEEDFIEFRRVTGILPDDLVLHDGEIVLSDTLAKNWGVSVGDVLKSGEDGWDKASFNYQDMTVAAIADIPGNMLFGVGLETPKTEVMILRSDPSSGDEAADMKLSEEMDEAAGKIKADYPHAYVQTNSLLRAEVKEEVGMMTMILAAVVVLLGIVLAVTVNAAFAAAYDKRKYEFSVYKALGFQSGGIFKKVLSEVLTLDVIGLVIGAAANAIAILIINYNLNPLGMGFERFSYDGLLGTAVCNLIVVIPTVLLAWKRVKKYDVTVY